MNLSRTPAYNLKAVLQETGIAADTLRAWERRYGLPMPERTAGGHRLYSQHDVHLIKWLMARQAEGLSISRAVDLWNEQTASGADPLADLHQQSAITLPGANLESVRREWLAACFQYDTVSADQLLNQAFAAHSIEIICAEVIQRGLFEIGELWHKGMASVQQEHFASGIAMRRLEALISATPPPTRTETILAVCPPNEWHAFPLLLTALFLRRRGWNVVYLGANVPIDRIEETINTVHPKLVVLSAQTLITAVSLREMARLLNQKGIQSAFGGRVFNHITGLSKHIPAHFLGNTIEFSIPNIENLVTNPIPVPEEEAIDRQTLHIAEEYKQKRPFIEAAILENTKSLNQTIEYLDTANHFLGDTLTAALELGNISYLSTDIDWLINLLIEHNTSVAMLPIFFSVYAQATRDILGDDGQPIHQWLALQAQKLKS